MSPETPSVKEKPFLFQVGQKVYLKGHSGGRVGDPIRTISEQLRSNGYNVYRLEGFPVQTWAEYEVEDAKSVIQRQASYQVAVRRWIEQHGTDLEKSFLPPLESKKK